MGNFNVLVYAVVGFLIANILIGLWAGRGVKTLEDYIVGKKK